MEGQGPSGLEREDMYNPNEQDSVRRIERTLNVEQRAAYNTIMRSVDLNKGELFLLEGPAGTGKSYLGRLLLANLEKQGKTGVGVVSTAAAAAASPGWKTAHSAFGLSSTRDLGEGYCCISERSERMLKECVLIFWDECSMAPKWHLEALDRSLQKLRRNNRVMGGTTVVLSGDFRQLTPVPTERERGRGGVSSIEASLKSSRLMEHVSKIPFSRKAQAHLLENKDFWTFLDGIEEGRGSNLKEKKSSRLGTRVNSLKELIKKVYPDKRKWETKPFSWWSERCILVSTIAMEDEVNAEILSILDGLRLRSDGVEADDWMKALATEEELYDPLQLPGHEINLKVGAVVLLLRDLDRRLGLLKGVRLRVTEFMPDGLEAQVLTGPAAGRTELIPKVLSRVSVDGEPSPGLYLQYPVKLAFAMTIHKSLGQNLSTLGLVLRKPCFAHDQLYAACSRVGSKKNLFLLHDDSIDNVVNNDTLDWGGESSQEGSPFRWYYPPEESSEDYF